ncbi:MAG: nucleotidyltransferase family protein [Acidobacteria bacterium]|nr:nucleotidyltransferase family protein [Acidobacteriota bacterium]
MPRKAVILARGLGTRMRAGATDAVLSPEQQRIAEAGIKALIPVAGDRTMLDLILENLSAAGFSDFVLVIGNEHAAIREFCASRGYDASFAIQKEPLGTSDAVLASAAEVLADELFLVVNSDNLYPVESLRRLRETNRPGLVAFARTGLIEHGNIAAERIAKFATIETNARGDLEQIVEKPEIVAPDSYVSMNAWLFSPAIFEACERIEPSPRGEFEITAAVQYAIDELGQSFAVVRSDEGVLDLSSRSDIETARLRIENREP